MLLANLLSQTAEVFRPTKVTDRLKNQMDVWSPTPTATYPCRLQEHLGTEDHTGRDLSIGQWRLYLLAPIDALTEHDRVRVGTRMFEVVAVYPVEGPRIPGTHHLRCIVESYSEGVAQ